MYGLNSSFTSTNARDYLDQLFSRRSAEPVQEQAAAAWTPPSWDRDSGTTAQDRALSKIISIIWDMQNGGGEKSESTVNGYNGYILDASGTDEADTIDMKGISAYNISSGDGDDTLNLKVGSLAVLEAGSGNDKVNIAADYAGAIDGGDGDDAINFTGDIADDVAGGAGDDTLRISARAILGANGGDGSDTLYLEAGRIFAAGGKGDDTIAIVNKGNRAAELAFAAGDGKDTIRTTGPLDIRFTSGDAGASAYGPDDLTVTSADGKLTISAKDGGDSMTIAFDDQALEGRTPTFEFVFDRGATVLQIR